MMVEFFKQQQTTNVPQMKKLFLLTIFIFTLAFSSSASFAE